jgi:hypothetical protein
VDRLAKKRRRRVVELSVCLQPWANGPGTSSADVCATRAPDHHHRQSTDERRTVQPSLIDTYSRVQSINTQSLSRRCFCRAHHAAAAAVYYNSVRLHQDVRSAPTAGWRFVDDVRFMRVGVTCMALIPLCHAHDDKGGCRSSHHHGCCVHESG